MKFKSPCKVVPMRCEWPLSLVLFRKLGRELRRIIYIAAIASSTCATAAVYPEEGKSVEWVQPDGTPLKLRVFGDDFYGRTATEDGRTVIFNPANLTYYYAQRGADGQSLVASEIPARPEAPAEIDRNLSEPRATVERIRQENIQEMVPNQQAEWAKRVEAAKMPAPRVKRGPLGVTKIGLALPVQFPDDPATAFSDAVVLPATQAGVENYCNQVGYSGFGNSGSVRDYYYDQSNGQLTFTQLVAPVVTLPHPRNYYNYSNYPLNTTLRDNVVAGQLMVSHAIAALQAGGFNFSSLSVDGNNRVIATSLLFAGADSGVWSEGLWPHRSSVSPEINVGTPSAPILISGYQITNAQFALTIGTYIHEVGHLLLGYPDLYDYGDESEGVGNHCLMGAANHLNNGRTPGPICLYLKSISGWAVITDVTPGAPYEADLPTTGNLGLRLRNPARPEEYFLIENRGSGDKWAAHSPDKGILIWHVDEAVYGNDNEQMTSAQHYEISVEQADGAFDLEHHLNRGDSSDLFDAATPYFNNGTPPDSRWWNGAISGIAVEVSSEPGATMNVLLGSAIPLGPAVEASHLAWTTGGNQPWAGQAYFTHDGADAGASGGIGHLQSSWAETTVTGPGTLTFWWAVSSEVDFDFLRFQIDGSYSPAVPQISGSVSWRSHTVPVPAGTHALRWTYSKDVSLQQGSDAGFLDQVAYYPGVAADVLVTTLTDEANGNLDPAFGTGTSLREALLHAPEPAVIGFGPWLDGGTITALGTQLTVGKSCAIDASALPNGVAISGNDDRRVFDVAAGKTVVMTGLKVIDGEVSGDGGGIRNAGNLTLNRCRIESNEATDDGGGIFNTGTLVANSTVFLGNSSGDTGGAVVSENSLALSLCIFDSNIAGGNGGAFLNDDGTATADNCDFNGNQALGSRGGGAIDNDNGGTVSLTRCRLTGNHANFDGGAIDSDGALTLSGCTLSGNSAVTGGGGIQQVSNTLTLTNCTMTANSAKFGGAIDGDNTSTLALVSCTISGNHASDDGGGIEESTGTLRLTNTIVAGNTAVDQGPDIKGSSINTQGGVNLLGTTSGLGGAYSGLLGAPLLAPLGGYGGLTPTMPPLAGSPAIDHGGASALATDQRGLPRTAGAATDIGAVETHPEMLVVSNTSATGPGSLREAITFATPGSTVRFAPALEGQEINLGGNQIALYRDLSIDASGLPFGVTISGGGASRIFDVGPGVDASLKGLVITGGYADEEEGGAIRNAGYLEMESCVVQNSIGGYDGGGIFNSGYLSMLKCSVTGNESSGGGGGGIANTGGLWMERSSVVRNGCGGSSGAGILCEGEDSFADFELCTIVDNSSNGSGGGIYLSGQVTLNQCTVANNISNWVSGIHNNGGFLGLFHSIIADNENYDEEVIDVSGPVGDQSDDNLISADFTTSGYTGLVAPARLGPLGLYGGPTLTMPPLADSPAINASSANDPGVDQRGLARVVGPAADLGAVEVGAALSEVVVTTGTNEDHGNLAGLISLREATRYAPVGSRIRFAPALEGTLVSPGTAEIFLGRSLIIDGSTLPAGVRIDGDYATRLFRVPAGHEVAVKAVTMSRGYSFEGGGGAVSIHGNLYLERSTLTGNSSAGGGGGGLSIRDAGRLHLNACTLEGNSANGGGGAIENRGIAYVTDSTIAGNDSLGGGGIDTDHGSLYLQNSIVAGNIVDGEPSDVLGYVRDLGANLLGTDDGTQLYSGMVADPLLSPLGDYGGPTPTMPPMAGSPAIDAGDVSPSAIDQRGLPRVSGAALDIGAVEVQSASLIVVTHAGASGAGSLRQAVADAAPGATITFAPALDGATIALGGNQIALESGVMIDASALPYGLAISGEGTSRVFDISAGAEVTLKSLVIVHGDPGIEAEGGGIRNAGRLKLEFCSIQKNFAEFNGGGIFNSGELTMLECTVYDNETSSEGAGISTSGDLSMSRCTVSSNGAGGGDGGGINVANSFAYVSLELCTVANNSCNGNGGGIFNRGLLDLTECTIAGNEGIAGAGVCHEGSFARLYHCIIADNEGSEMEGLSDFGGVVDEQSDDNLMSTAEGAIGYTGIVGPAKLAPLGPYGGPTLTMPPLAGSLAINASSSGRDIDQRGMARIVGFAADLGAAESGAEIPSVTVTTLADEDDGGLDGQVSLREAVRYGAVGSKVLFAEPLDGLQITLGGGGELVLARNQLIDVAGLPHGMAVSGNEETRIFRVPIGRHAALTGLTLIDGYSVLDAGGAVRNEGALWIASCTLSANGAAGGGAGAIYNAVDGLLQLDGCTLADNSSNGSGGAIESLGWLYVTDCTIVGNESLGGGGIASEGPLFMANTIVAGNTGDGEPNDVSGFIVERGLNLLSTAAGTGGFGGLVANPLLAPLGGYGGPTFTMPPLPGSPAIDAGTGSPLAKDQRGLPRVSGAAVDIGAVEAVGFSTLGLPDSDGDGIPDLLEPALNFTVGTDDSAVDRDGDGSTDAEEIANMTDPWNAGSYFRITSFAPAPGFNPVSNRAFEVSFPTFPGLSYLIEADPQLDFTGAGYQVLVPPFTATGTTATYQVMLGAGRDFIRVKCE